MIVVEGPDNSGKTTLADMLCQKFGLVKLTAGPAPSTHAEMIKCVINQRARRKDRVVFDRVTCISQQVYWGVDALLDSYAQQMAVETVIVYCRPPERTLMDFSTHRIKGYDTEESLKRIMDNQHIFIERYDEIMGRIRHVRYDWTDEGLDKEGFLDRIYDAMKNPDAKDDLYRGYNVFGL